MKALFNYISDNNITEDILDYKKSKEKSGSGTSDDALYYRTGIYQYEWKLKTSKKTFQSVIDKYNIKGDNKRAGIIAWQKDVAYPILPEKFEAVPRNEWELDIFNGISTDALYHPHYDRQIEYIYKHHKPRHKILTVFECSNKKPYCYVGSLRYFEHRWADYTDFASLSGGIQPWEFSNMYPIRWEEWNHFAEDSYMQYLNSEVTKDWIIEYHKHFPQYEKIIFICQAEHTQRPVNELWDENRDNFRDWAIVFTNDGFRKKIANAYPQMKGGILIQRTLGFDYTHKKYADLLASFYSKEEDKEEIKRRIHMSTEDLEKEGIYNIFSPEVAKEAYKQGAFPFDEKFMKEYKQKFIESKKSNK